MGGISNGKCLYSRGSRLNILTIDFETFYDKDYSLSKLTTEQYIRALDKFEVIGVAVKVNDGETEWFSGSHADTAKFLNQFNWSGSAALAHNTMFDAAILMWVFNIRPKVWFDTLSMGQALVGSYHSVSLAALTELYEVGRKGTEVLKAIGKRRLDFSEEELHHYGNYCINDVNITYELFKVLVDCVPKKELRLIDLTIRMFSEPVLEVDDRVLTKELKTIQEHKQSLLDKSGLDKKTLASNPKFAKFLESLGVEPPRKISPTTGRETYALAKLDEGFKALLDHEDERVQIATAARVGTKSTINETRIERLIQIAGRGALPIPLRYYAAHTGRWGGSDKINLQNLPKNRIREGIKAPKGSVIVDADSSQIEARVLAWFSGQENMLQLFRKGEDTYKQMAANIYGISVKDVTPDQRFLGKTVVLGCGYGMGANKFQATMKSKGVSLTEQEAKHIIYAYRKTVPCIADLWKQGQTLLKHMTARRLFAYRYREGVVSATKEGIKLPNGMIIHYKNIREERDEDAIGGSNFLYDGKKGKVTTIYGGKLTENIVQALARILISEQMLLIARLYKVVLTVHDAVACVVPEAEKEEAIEYIKECMSYTPEWAKGLPLTCTVGWGYNYGSVDK